MLSHLIFIVLALVSIGLFSWKMRSIIKQIKLGRPTNRRIRTVRKIFYVGVGTVAVGAFAVEAYTPLFGPPVKNRQIIRGIHQFLPVYELLLFHWLNSTHRVRFNVPALVLRKLHAGGREFLVRFVGIIGWRDVGEVCLYIDMPRSASSVPRPSLQNGTIRVRVINQRHSCTRDGARTRACWRSRERESTRFTTCRNLQ